MESPVYSSIKKGSFVISLDYDLKMLKKGLKKSKITKGQAVLADARCLPFKDDSFDLVYSRYVLHCVKAYFRCMKEMKRTMKPEGEIQIIDICAPVLEIKEFLERCHFEKPPPLSSCAILTKDELLSKTTKLGFYITTMEWSTLKEKESSRKLKSYIQKELPINPVLRENVKIRKGKRNFYIHLPVVMIRGKM
jgi:ubiquinone/menaquinone biosynthesis C-methylase UbiE